MWGQVERTSEDTHSGSIRETLLERNRQPGWRVTEKRRQNVYIKATGGQTSRRTESHAGAVGGEKREAGEPCGVWL